MEVAEQAEEDEAIDAEEDEMIDAAGDGEPTRTGTLKYFLQHLHEPIVPGASISVLQ